MYHALQIIVVLTLYEERLPPIVIWFVEWLRDIIQLNILPRTWLTPMLSISFFRILYNAGGMLLIFSPPVFTILYFISFCSKATCNPRKRTTLFCTMITRRMTYDWLIRLFYVSYLPLCLAAGVGR